MDKNVNLIKCSGRITYLRYDEESNRFTFVLYIAVPKASLRNSVSQTSVLRDAPMFVYKGSDARELYDRLKLQDFITLIGHAETEEVLKPIGGRMFKSVYEVRLFADSILPLHGLSYDNTVVLAGKVVHVYANDDPGKHFYIITIDTQLDDGQPTRLSFTYFDQKMQLNPQKDDYIHAFGILQVKHEEDQENKRGRILTTVVARTVGLVSGNGNQSAAQHSSSSQFKLVRPENSSTMLKKRQEEEDVPQINKEQDEPQTNNDYEDVSQTNNDYEDDSMWNDDDDWEDLE